MPTPAIRVAIAAAAVISAGGLVACSSAHQAPPASASTRAVAALTEHAVTQHAVTRREVTQRAVTRRTVLQFVSTDEAGNMTLEDLGAKSAPGGPDIGDLLAFTQTLTRDGKPAGQVHVVAVGVDHTRHLSEATGTITLARGTVQLAGIVTMNPSFTLTVTGGTGAYTGDTGTLAFTADRSVQKLTLHLTSPARS